MTHNAENDAAEPFIVNEYGAPVTELTCVVCGKTVTICPAIPPDEIADRWGDGCLTPDCPTYDITRDADIFFEPALAAGWIKRGPPSPALSSGADEREEP